MYSYKEPRDKPLFDTVTKMWITFLSTIFVALLAYGIYLYARASSFGSDIEQLREENINLSNGVNSLKSELRLLQTQAVLSQKVLKSNHLVANSIKNLFNLVPDQIVLSKVIMKRDSLRLEGLSSTKDAYRLLLEPPLKSIFDESSVKFKFDSKIGSYKFVSINKSQASKQEGGQNVKE